MKNAVRKGKARERVTGTEVRVVFKAPSAAVWRQNTRKEFV